MEQKNIDRYGTCPNCGKSWDGGDIREKIGEIDVYQFRPTKEVDAVAEMFGWTPENNKRFSKVKVYEISLPLVKYSFIECHNCLYVYDEVNGESYPSIYRVREILSDPIGDDPIE